MPLPKQTFSLVIAGTGKINVVSNGSVPLNVPVSCAGEPVCTIQGPSANWNAVVLSVISNTLTLRARVAQGIIYRNSRMTLVTMLLPLNR